jgi:hypothetical protein
MFVEVEKITEKKDGIKVVIETINLSEIKGIREWHKSAIEKEKIKGDVTILYLQSLDPLKSNDMKINENYNAFISRIGTSELKK